ncbi:hypothetical protein WJX75_009548 [Coccomyxa subellipsoidea]|uniref:Uncharacterized protein n=1 Tax=Coccomyxa subellipsoidea TaxID=248742 RepID=A0ABR2YBB0_9CHLO
MLCRPQSINKTLQISGVALGVSKPEFGRSRDFSRPAAGKQHGVVTCRARQLLTKQGAVPHSQGLPGGHHKQER